MDYTDILSATEDKYKLPRGLLHGQMHAESAGNPNAVSPKGAQGLMQFMPATAKQYGIDPLDPHQAIDGAGRMMRDMVDQAGSVRGGVAAYNWGIGNVKRKGLSAMPKETRDYIQRVSGVMRKVALGAGKTVADGLSGTANAGEINNSAPVKSNNLQSDWDSATPVKAVKPNLQIDWDSATPVKAVKPNLQIDWDSATPVNNGLSIKNIIPNAKDLLGGAVRGAGSIGSTILAASELTPMGVMHNLMNNQSINPMQRDTERRKGMDEGLKEMGVDANSGLFKTGKIGTEIAGTLPVGNILGVGAKALGATKLGNAIASGGMNLGNTGGNAVANGLTRMAGGAINGGAQAGLINPDDAGTGALVGGALPVVSATGRAAVNGLDDMAHSLMQSALKPTIAQRQSGQADRAVQTLLDEGINATRGGVDKLKSRIGDINEQIKLGLANSNETVRKQDVISTLNDVRGKFSNQVSPTGDLNSIQGIADDFINHPNFAGDTIPIQQAQALKQGTYRVLSGKFGETGSAATEAQKALARGLKEQIAKAHPNISALNSRESDLINALKITERRALLDGNKNPIGLGLLAPTPAALGAFLADRSALVKSLAAALTNSSAQTAKNQSLAKALLENVAPKTLPAYAAD